MSNSANEKLRHLLDERGVEWRTYRGTEKQITCVDSLKCVYEEIERGKIRVIRYFDTPAEAIEGTLGRGECRIETVTTDARDWPDNERCTGCGEFVSVLKPMRPRFCPNCGRKVVEE